MFREKVRELYNEYAGMEQLCFYNVPITAVNHGIGSLVVASLRDKRHKDRRAVLIATHSYTSIFHH